MKMNKKGKSGIQLQWVIVIGILLIGLTLFAAYLFLPRTQVVQTPLTTSPTGEQQTAPVQVTSSSCEIAPSVKFTAVREWSEGTAITDASVLYQVYDESTKTWSKVQQSALDTAITFNEKGAKFRYLLNSTTHADTELQEMTINECGAKPAITVKMKDAMDAAADLTLKIKNYDDDQTNSLSLNDTIDTGQDRDIMLTISPASYKGGNDCVLSMHFNGSTFDALTPKIDGVDLVEYEGGVSANWFSVTAGWEAYHYKIGDIGNGVDKTIKIFRDVAASVDPSPTGGLANPVLYVNCEESYIDSLTGELKRGLQNNLKNEVIDGTANTLTTTYYVA